MIIGTLTDGTKCVYDLPNNIKTAEEMQSLVKPQRSDVERLGNS